MTTLRDAAMQSKAWPFEEARRVLKRYEKQPRKGLCPVRDGLWPLGPAPYRHLRRGRAHDDDPPRLSGDQRHPDAADLFSDDLDGMRKVPENVPDQEMLKEHLQLP